MWELLLDTEKYLQEQGGSFSELACWSLLQPALQHVALSGLRVLVKG